MRRLTIATLTCLAACLSIGCGDDGPDMSDASQGPDLAGPDGGGHDGAHYEHPVQQLDRSHYTDVGTDGPLDYSVPEMWVCRPDLSPNECEEDLTATEIRPDGTRVRVEHQRAEDPDFDCFYVYPTVLLTGEPQMVDFSESGVEIVKDALLTQGARFSSMCRMFAPLYRQTGLSGGVPVAGADANLAIQDVRDAFAYYLEQWNDRRKYVLLGHSQGTRMLIELVKQDIDPDAHADVRERMLSALLIGSLNPIWAPAGQAAGGTFENIPICTQEGETGCVIAYTSYAQDAPPGEGDLFGRSTADGDPVACVNPAVLAGNPGRYSASYFHKGISNSSFRSDNPLPEDLETPFALYRELFRGNCVQQGGFSYLELAVEPEDGDMRLPPWRHAALESLGFGLHLVDYHIPLGDLLAAVARQAGQ